MQDKAQHFRRLEQMYLSAPCNVYYQPTIAISEGAAEVRNPIQPSFFHAANATHGSVYFKAMDDAAFFAANSVVMDVFVLTVSFNIYLTRPIASGEMISSGKLISASKNLFVAEAVLTDDRGREIGRGSGSFMRSRIPLSAEVGYR